MSGLAFPFRIGPDGRSATAEGAAHLAALVELVLFTDPGERVNRPEFGSGARQLVFAGAGGELATAVEFLISGALQRWLGELLRVEAVRVAATEGRLEIDIAYRAVGDDEPRRLSLSREM